MKEIKKEISPNDDGDHDKILVFEASSIEQRKRGTEGKQTEVGRFTLCGSHSLRKPNDSKLHS